MIQRSLGILFSLVFLVIACNAHKADLIIFSYNRPMQLYALLESTSMYLEHVGQVHVIYRASDERFESSYAKVKEKFPDANFVRQSNNPTQDFKELTLRAFNESAHDYVLFAVDDIVVKDFVDLDYCIRMMQKTEAYGFYLRLGQNITYSYSNNAAEPLPSFVPCASDVLQWQCSQGAIEWRYPNTVDMTIYAKKDIESAVRSLSYTNPNTFEASWAGAAGSVMHRPVLCYTSSKIVNVPLNRIQNTHLNRHMNSYSCQELLELFEQGKKIDIHDLYKISNISPHMDYTPRFVARVDEPVSDGSIHFVLVIASYNNARWYQANLDSVRTQNYENYEVIYIDDCSDDCTGELVERYVRDHGMERKVTLIRNKVRLNGALENQYRACYACNDEYVIVILDGDDFLAHDQVLSYLNNVYQQKAVWMTYGQFVEYPSGAHGFCCPMPEQIVAANGFRDYPHIPSHIRTFYAGLFKQIHKKDLMLNGEFLKMTGDMAAMLPMIEMARMGHFRFIADVLYVYNAINPLSDHRVSKQLQRDIDLEIRRRNRYEPVSHVARG